MDDQLIGRERERALLRARGRVRRLPATGRAGRPLRQGGGRYLVCPICFDARQLDKGQLIEVAELGGTVPMWQWIGDDGATTFSY